MNFRVFSPVVSESLTRFVPALAMEKFIVRVVSRRDTRDCHDTRWLTFGLKFLQWNLISLLNTFVVVFCIYYRMICERKFLNFYYIAENRY